MSDLTPNDLSHLSDDEFNALCPHDAHAPGPEPLSPAARAVWEAFNSRFDWVEDGVPGPQYHSVAAALRAAALYSYCPVDWRILMTIATELENHQ